MVKGSTFTLRVRDGDVDLIKRFVRENDLRSSHRGELLSPTQVMYNLWRDFVDGTVLPYLDASGVLDDKKFSRNDSVLVYLGDGSK